MPICRNVEGAHGQRKVGNPCTNRAFFTKRPRSIYRKKFWEFEGSMKITEQTFPESVGNTVITSSNCRAHPLRQRDKNSEEKVQGLVASGSLSAHTLTC